MQYILVFRGTDFFLGQNLYLGCADITNDINRAKLMDIEEAEQNWSLMKEKKDWTIWSVKHSIALDLEYKKHILKQRKFDLEQQLKAVEKELGL